MNTDTMSFIQRDGKTFETTDMDAAVELAHATANEWAVAMGVVTSTKYPGKYKVLQISSYMMYPQRYARYTMEATLKPDQGTLGFDCPAIRRHLNIR